MTCLNFRLADTNDDVMKFNNEKLQQLLATNSLVGAITQAPNELIKEKLNKIKYD
jgi:hypothetical protein